MENCKALLIGVWAYESAAHLHRVRNDIDEFGRIIASNGYQVSKCENPTGDQFRKKLKDFFEQIDNESNVVVYFSGHGILSDANEFYYAAADCTPEFQTLQAINSEIFKDMIKNKKPSQVIFIIDACYGEGAMPEKSTEQTTRAFKRFLKETRTGSSSTKVAIIAAADRDSTAPATDPNSDQRLSPFTELICRGIEKIEVEHPYIYVESLFDFVVAESRSRGIKLSPVHDFMPHDAIQTPLINNPRRGWRNVNEEVKKYIVSKNEIEQCYGYFILGMQYVNESNKSEVSGLYEFLSAAKKRNNELRTPKANSSLDAVLKLIEADRATERKLVEGDEARSELERMLLESATQLEKFREQLEERSKNLSSVTVSFLGLKEKSEFQSEERVALEFEIDNLKEKVRWTEREVESLQIQKSNLESQLLDLNVTIGHSTADITSLRRKHDLLELVVVAFSDYVAFDRDERKTSQTQKKLVANNYQYENNEVENLIVPTEEGKKGTVKGRVQVLVYSLIFGLFIAVIAGATALVVSPELGFPVDLWQRIVRPSGGETKKQLLTDDQSPNISVSKENAMNSTSPPSSSAVTPSVSDQKVESSNTEFDDHPPLHSEPFDPESDVYKVNVTASAPYRPWGSSALCSEFLSSDPTTWTTENLQKMGPLTYGVRVWSKLIETTQDGFLEPDGEIYLGRFQKAFPTINFSIDVGTVRYKRYWMISIATGQKDKEVTRKICKFAAECVRSDAYIYRFPDYRVTDSSPENSCEDVMR
jgi:hypothetical protein